MGHLEALKSGDTVTLKNLSDTVTIELIKYKDLVAIGTPDYLKRYNPLYLSVKNNSDNDLGLLLVTVCRVNSKIGSDNRCTIPLNLYGLKPNSKAKYQLLAFDPFNKKFGNIEVRLTTIEDWADRSINEIFIGRATEFSKRLKWYNLT
jgi:hypothetical protein